jgi:hypothetical protein
VAGQRAFGHCAADEISTCLRLNVPLRKSVWNAVWPVLYVSVSDMAAHAVGWYQCYESVCQKGFIILTATLYTFINISNVNGLCP